MWVNEQLVGYNEDSKVPAEFNITKFLKGGENSVAVEVYRWCDGSYLEDQDFWRLSGIQRTVFLHARPKTFIRDFFAVGDLENNYNDGLLKLNVSLKSVSDKIGDFEVVATLFDDGQELYTETKDISLADNISIGLIAGGLYEKMITSASGLIVGVLAYAGYHYLNILLDKVIFRMEDTAIEFMDLLEQKEA